MALLILTTGIDVGMIQYLAQYEKCYVFSDYISGFPDMEDLAIARNLDNVEVLTEFTVDLNKIDKVVTFDCYYGFIIELFKKLGKEVFGAGNESTIENNRLLQKRLFPSVSPYKKKTLDELKAPSVVKVNPYYRGSFETQIFNNQAEVEFFKNKLKIQAGKFAEEIDYFEEPIIEKDLETGIDAVALGDGLAFPLFLGIEQDKSTYIAKRIDNWDDLYKTPMIPNILVLDKVLKEAKYVGFVSTEEIIEKGKLNASYLIDICMRLALPLGLSYQKVYGNLYDVVRFNMSPRMPYEYVYVVPLSSKLSNEYFVPAVFTDEEVFEKYICLGTFYKPKKQKVKKGIELYFIKGFTTIGCIVLGSNRLVEFEELEKVLKRIYDTIEIPDLIDETETLKKNYENFVRLLKTYNL